MKHFHGHRHFHMICGSDADALRLGLLLDEGTDVNAEGRHYGNALQAASAGGHEKVVQILVNAGAQHHCSMKV